ncbi:uncharacterized protein LOC121530512 [Drosophila eugracilis]|uniref:uncharacterized protein LOC121530512 n=1 Tax=Drosophila eugracilis TaxID=29029 RepID=UPI001BDAF792|nr:uncharacterized protein LOC121530512 [Drosophila eugracilis]
MTVLKEKSEEINYEVYEVTKIRRELKEVISSCNECKLQRTRPMSPIMAPLPEDRLEAGGWPFKYTGLDYFGPLLVTVARHREKRWFALFTCLTSRAIHLELAHDLSTDSCTIAIRNFVCRRGPVRKLRSENGKNFVGADREARRFGDVFETERIQSELSSRSIEWVFNCPSNPSEGGVWERMVQCFKRVLRHTLKEVAPRDHVLESLLIEAENIVASAHPLAAVEGCPLAAGPLLEEVGHGVPAYACAPREVVPENGAHPPGRYGLRLRSCLAQTRVAQGHRGGGIQS